MIVLSVDWLAYAWRVGFRNYGSFPWLHLLLNFVCGRVNELDKGVRYSNWYSGC